MRVGARRAWLAGAALLLAAGVAGQLWLGGVLEQRFRRALDEAEAVRGSFERVTVCLPCLSYTVHGISLDTRGPGGRAPLLRAGAVRASLLSTAWLRGAPRGAIALRGAELHLDLGGEEQGRPTAFHIPWQELGATLLPLPIERVDAVGGAVFLRYDRYAEPILWRFGVTRGAARGLADPGGGRVHLAGTTPGQGAFELELRPHPESPERTQLQAALRDVPLEVLGDYIRQRFSLDVEAGRLSARADLEAGARGWTGAVETELADVDVFALDDLVEHGPLQAARDGVAGLAASVSRSSDGAVRVRLAVDERFDGSVDRWSAAVRIVRWLVLAPFRAPLALFPTPGGDAGERAPDEG